MKKRKIKRGDLLPWFLEDHDSLPAWYIKDCQEFFEWLKQSNKDRRKLNWHLYGGTPNFTNLRQIVAGTINHRKETMSNKPQATSNKQSMKLYPTMISKKLKHQATSDKRLSKTAMKIHEAWCMKNGYLKQQASSVKQQGSRYKSSDYQKRAT